jgi:hypothetical protein
MAEPRWWLQKNGEVVGPFTLAELRERLAAGALDPDDLLCPEGASDWFPVRTLPELFPSWRIVAAHGRRVGRWSAGASVALLALYVAANNPQKFSDSEFWMSWLCFGIFAGSAGYWIGYAFGAVIKRITRKTDVAMAVTTTATVAFFVLCLGMAAVYLSGVWREDRRRDQEIRERINNAGKNPPAAKEPARK